VGIAIRQRVQGLCHEAGATGVKYAFMLALLVAAAMLYVPGLGARMYGSLAELTGMRLAHWFN